MFSRLPLDQWKNFKTTKQSLKLYHFDPKSKKWDKLKVLSKSKLKPITSPELKIITFNVWFSNFEFHTRFVEQMKIFENISPDVIGLQEVTPKYLGLLATNKYIKENFIISDNPTQPKTLFNYGCLILVNKKRYEAISEVNKLILPSEMYRDLINCNLLIENSKKEKIMFNIGTIHLESLGSSSLRQLQLDKISKDVQIKYPDAMLMGDFNFDSDKNYVVGVGELENNFLTKHGGDWVNYLDIWKHLHPDESGYTFDTESNLMLANHKKELMRYDRIMLKSKNFKPKEIRMIGIQSCKNQKNVFPSDHYGLFATLEL